MDALIRLGEVTKRYAAGGPPALDNLSLSVAAGEAVAVMRRQARARCAELLGQLGIARYRDTYPGRLSGGERQRVAIARSLINDPAVLLADEPTGAVDTATGEEIGQLLLDLNAAGQTLILVTHSPDLAARYAKRTVRLVDGRIASDNSIPQDNMSQANERDLA
jgi:putative ABC transport system ATP-binding protein